MDGLHIEYEYSGDEAAWSETIQTFLSAVASDRRLADAFRYHVFVKADGKTRVHVPTWDNAETLAHLQAQAYFKTFAAAGTLKTTKLKFAG